MLTVMAIYLGYEVWVPSTISAFNDHEGREGGVLKKLEAQEFIRSRTCGQCPSTGAIGQTETKKQSDLVRAQASNPKDGEGSCQNKEIREDGSLLYCSL